MCHCFKGLSSKTADEMYSHHALIPFHSSLSEKSMSIFLGINLNSASAKLVTFQMLMNLLLGILNAARLILNAFISFEISYILQGKPRFAWVSQY